MFHHIWLSIFMTRSDGCKLANSFQHNHSDPERWFLDWAPTTNARYVRSVGIVSRPQHWHMYVYIYIYIYIYI